MKIFVERNHNVVFENEREICVEKSYFNVCFICRFIFLLQCYLRGLKHIHQQILLQMFFNGHWSLYKSKVVVKFDVRKCQGKKLRTCYTVVCHTPLFLYRKKTGWELVGKLPWICPALEPVLSCTMPADLDLKTKQQVFNNRQSW
jgi:hypothetical protein